MFISDLPLHSSFSHWQVGVKKVQRFSVVSDECSVCLSVLLLFLWFLIFSFWISPFYCQKILPFRYLYNVSGSFLITNSHPEGWLAQTVLSSALVCPTLNIGNWNLFFLNTSKVEKEIPKRRENLYHAISETI